MRSIIRRSGSSSKIISAGQNPSFLQLYLVKIRRHFYSKFRINHDKNYRDTKTQESTKIYYWLSSIHADASLHAAPQYKRGLGVFADNIGELSCSGPRRPSATRRRANFSSRRRTLLAQSNLEKTRPQHGSRVMHLAIILAIVNCKKKEKRTLFSLMLKKREKVCGAALLLETKP